MYVFWIERLYFSIGNSTDDEIRESQYSVEVKYETKASLPVHFRKKKYHIKKNLRKNKSCWHWCMQDNLEENINNKQDEIKNGKL